jgi:hypothetical protein
MYGNFRGWVIAGVLFLAIIAAVWRALKINEISSPTAFSKSSAVTQVLELPVAFTTLVFTDVTTDATSLYQQAMSDVRTNMRIYEQAAAEGSQEMLAQLPAVRAALQAAPMRSAKLLLARPAQNVGYSTQEADDIKAVKLLSDCLGRAGLLAFATDKKQSRQYFAAQGSLGHKMFAERINYWQAYFGVGQMRTAATGLQILARDAQDVDEMERIDRFLQSSDAFVKSSLEPVWKVLSSVDSKIIGRHAGDIYAMTGPEVKERLWRIEAILKLGRHKYNVQRLADQTIVPFRLAELKQTETDPAVLSAIDAADQLTVEQYRMIK